MEDRNMKKMEKSNTLLNVLCLEDVLKDAELLNEMLVDAGYLVSMDIATGEKEYLSFLKGRNYDIILADYTLPGFDVHVALKLALELQPEVPFICASGTISEDKAVELLKLGATDYVFKDRLGRLAFAVRKALEGVANQKERKKAEEELKKSYALLRIAGEKAKLGGWSVNLEENRSIWSDEVAAIHEMPTGYSPLLEDGINFYAPEWRERITKVFTDCAQEGIPYDEEMEIITANGKRVWVQTIGEPIKNDSGKIIKVQGAFQDITERKKAADAIRESRKELDTLFEASPELISFIGFDGYFKRLNPAWVKTLGYPMDKLLSLPFIEFVHPDDREATNAEVAKLAEGQRTIRFENRYRCNDGSYRWLSWSVIPDTNEKLLYAVARDITERKRTEDALRESERKFRNYIDYAPHGVFVADEKGNYVEVNSAASNITGYSKDELLSMKLFELIPEESMEFSARHFEKVVRDGFATGEFPFIKKDRSIGYWSVEAVKLSDQRFLGFVVDVTKRKQAEDMLRESKVKYQEIFESTGTATFIFDENAITLMANNECYSITGYTPTEMIGHKLNQYFAPESLQEIMKNHKLRSQTPDLAPKKYEVKLVNKKGEKRDVILNVGMISGTKQRIVSILDITERNRAEQAILQSEKNFRRSISESPLGIRIVSVDGKTIYANKAFLDIFEFTRLEEFTNISAINRYTPESYAQHQERKEKRKNGHEAFDYEISIVRKNAEIRHVKISRKEVLWNGIKHYQVINIDITEQKKLTIDLIEAKEHAEQSDRLKSAFLANMSHEVRTPLNSIIGFSELLADPDFEEEQKDEFIQHIITSGNNLLSIISDIMDISKMESGEITIRNNQINILKFISTVKEKFSSQTESKKLEFKLTLPDNDEETVIIADADRLMQVFINLISNAIKFTANGRIEIGYQPKGKMVEFFVSDTGIGIPAEYHTIIFERFRQVEAEKTRKYGGNGLGLAISKNLVELMGGEIWFESESGNGSTFYFTIPYHAEPEGKNVIQNDALSEGAENQINSKVSGLKILIAEDDKESAKLITMAVRKFGNEILKATIGVEAIEACRNNPDIDLVLMDIRMPIMDGYEATRQIRQFNKEVVIIAQTAYALTGDREKAIEAGCNDYISKPIKKDELMGLVQKYFKK